MFLGIYVCVNNNKKSEFVPGIPAARTYSRFTMHAAVFDSEAPLEEQNYPPEQRLQGGKYRKRNHLNTLTRPRRLYNERIPCATTGKYSKNTTNISL